MVDLEAQGEKMKMELCRYFKNPLYWIVLAVGLSVRTVLAIAAKTFGRYPQIFGAKLDR